MICLKYPRKYAEEGCCPSKDLLAPNCTYEQIDILPMAFKWDKIYDDPGNCGLATLVVLLVNKGSSPALVQRVHAKSLRK